MLNRKSSVFERAKARRTENASTDSNVATTANGSATSSAPHPKGRMLKDLTDQLKKGIPIGTEPSALSAVLDAVRHSESIDDRKLLLEHALSFISNLPPGEFAQDAQDRVIKLLYNDLYHPPATCIGNKYAWRTADGSFNNVSIPEMGRAGEPYARSVQQSHPLPAHELPDPGLIFDTLLKREGFVKHPAGLSSLMFSFAALVIHTCFRTSHTDVNINETSSYVDLSPLYGHNQASQDKVRDRNGGRGFLYPDVFAEDRLLLLPPAVCVILVLFSRNHNYIAEKLFEINERGTFEDPTKLSREKLLQQDEEIFQTARLVNCGWFGSAVFSDYVSCILGLVRQGSNWTLNPFEEIRNSDHSTFERGNGNVCSVEFNCLYRWHATTSVEDEKWVNQVFENVFEGKRPEDVQPADFKAAAKKLQSTTPDIKHWTFGGLDRQENGMFKDEDLANVLKNATEHPAGAFRARGTPASMRLHEIMGIMQNRQWGVCSLNDFRRYLGLKPYSSFLEWNPDPEIAYAAEKLYGNIEYLELYVGLQAEESKPVVEGAGLCPGYTISRAILSDAIALTRGDRYFTHDYTPFNLTAWGFADCQRDPNAYGFGSTLGRLFLRTLPKQFTENSVYAFFALQTPESMKTYLKKLKLDGAYDADRPTPSPAYTVASDYSQVGDILKSSAFTAPQYQERASRIVKGKGFFSTAESREEQEKVLEILSSTESLEHTRRFFFETTIKLIEGNSWTLPGSKACVVDLVRDVFKAVPAYWVAELAGIPLKTSASSSGVFTPNELFEMLGDIYSFVFLDVEMSRVRVLQARVQAHVETLTDHIETGLRLGLKRLSVAGLIGTVSSLFSRGKQSESHVIVKKLQDLGYSNDQLTNTILAIMVGAVPELSLALTNMVNLILDSSQEDAVRGLANDANANFAGFAKESLRLDPPFQGVFRVAANDQAVSGQSYAKGSKIFLDLVTACQNEKAFPNPQSFNINRVTKHHLFTDDGIYRCLGEVLTEKIMGEVLRAVFSLNGIKRAPENSGKLKRFQDQTRPELRFAYLSEAKKVSPWPTSISGDTVLVILDPAKRADYSIFFGGLEARGYELTFRSPKDETPLLIEDDLPKFAHVVLLGTDTKNFAKDITPQVLVQLLSGNTNLLIALSPKQNLITSLAPEFSLILPPPNTPLISHFPERKEPANVVPISIPRSSVDTPPILTPSTAPIWFSGIPFALGQNPLLFPILNAPAESFAADADATADVLADAAEKGGEGLWAGTQLAVAAGFQALGGARVAWVGGAEVFSDAFANKDIEDGVKSGNKQFAQDVAAWAFQENLVLRIDDASHQYVNGSTPEHYTINDQVEYTVSISKYNPKFSIWEPYSAITDMQLEFTMLDPHIRTALPRSEGRNGKKEKGVYRVQFRAPDRHGVFKFVLDYKRKGWTHLQNSITVPVVPPRHDGYPRFLSAAWPYYAGAISTSVGFFLFAAGWLAGDVSSNDAKKAGKAE
ncbi:hypothetical protein VNI00_005806 [Paramarasmius palmivorus]|uniref:Dolichyl-diphosphooligosaccharide--protein glycosyltransferase subunit WBP1 n=1 Tax=Paramarasmius palmivorus TaxID=297713 RepID=A0AAW0DFW0_9AGAR